MRTVCTCNETFQLSQSLYFDNLEDCWEQGGEGGLDTSYSFSSQLQMLALVLVIAVEVGRNEAFYLDKYLKLSLLLVLQSASPQFS